jgi:Thioredoxin
VRALSSNLCFVVQRIPRFIEHYSPYCHHCRDFAPTWTKLVEDIGSLEDPGISFAQVNCATHGGGSPSLTVGLINNHGGAQTYVRRTALQDTPR